MGYLRYQAMTIYAGDFETWYIARFFIAFLATWRFGGSISAFVLLSTT